MLLLGIVMSPYVLKLLKPELMSVSSDLRIIVLIVVLLRAGFELSKETLRKVGVYGIVAKAFGVRSSHLTLRICFYKSSTFKLQSAKVKIFFSILHFPICILHFASFVLRIEPACRLGRRITHGEL